MLWGKLDKLLPQTHTMGEGQETVFLTVCACVRVCVCGGWGLCTDGKSRGGGGQHICSGRNSGTVYVTDWTKTSLVVGDGVGERGSGRMLACDSGGGGTPGLQHPCSSLSLVLLSAPFADFYLLSGCLSSLCTLIRAPPRGSVHVFISEVNMKAFVRKGRVSTIC